MTYHQEEGGGLSFSNAGIGDLRGSKMWGGGERPIHDINIGHLPEASAFLKGVS